MPSAPLELVPSVLHELVVHVPPLPPVPPAPPAPPVPPAPPTTCANALEGLSIGTMAAKIASAAIDKIVFIIRDARSSLLRRCVNYSIHIFSALLYI